MPLFSRGRADLSLPSPLLEEDHGKDASQSPTGPSLALARILREALAALERPRLASDEIAVHMTRLNARTPDARDLEL